DVVFNSTTANDDIIADNTPPDPPTDFKAFTTATSGHGKVNLTWTVGADGFGIYKGLVAKYNNWTYPTYAVDPGYPATSAAGTTVSATPLAGATATHTIAPRGIYKYTAFSVDWAGNYSTVVGSAQQDQSQNYFLGDLGSGAGANLPGLGGYNGLVNFDDLVWFSNLYFSNSGSWDLINNGAEANFGPTMANKTYPANHRLAVPNPSAAPVAVNFEDLMIFSMNYMNTTPKIAVPSDPQIARQFAVELMKGRSSTSQGEMLTVTVRVANDGREIKGVTAELNFDPSVMQFVDATSGGLFGAQQQGFVFAKAENNKVRIDAAVLGIDRTINFSGNLVVVRFHVLQAGQGDVTIDNAVVRNGDNGEQIPVLNNNAMPMPVVFALTQNYPNPFNPSTRIDYQVPATSPVTVEVFNVLGEKVATLVNEVKEAGYYNVVWNGRNAANQQVASGLYIYTMRAGEFTNVKKMMLLK
ncbi:MAG: cohesin domain-containing protein, partial [bacterium]